MRQMSTYHVPMTARVIAGVFASVVTAVCAGMAAVSAIERAPDALGAFMFALMAVVMVVGSHVLPALAGGRNWLVRLAFLVCVGVTLYNHAFFFNSRAQAMGEQRQAHVAPSADATRYEQELARISARDLPVVASDIAAASAVAAKAQAALERCQAKDGVRCTSAVAALQIAQAKLAAFQDERQQAMRAEDLRVQLAAAIAEHSGKVRAAGVSAVDASIANLIGVRTETVVTVMTFAQSIVLEVMGAILWAVALPKRRKIERKPVERKQKIQEVRIKHIVPYNPTPKAPRLIGWVQKAIVQHQAQPRDSPNRHAGVLRPA